MEKTICPNCKSGIGVRTIFYGMPAEPIDEDIYADGGCCLSESNPTKTCVDCQWEGNFVSVEKLMSID